MNASPSNIHPKKGHFKCLFWSSMRWGKCIATAVLLISTGCQEKKDSEEVYAIKEKPADLQAPEGMVWIPGGEFSQGAIEKDVMAMQHEKPAHKVIVDGFFMDKTEVTNAEFQKFADATGYVTLAERKIDWEEVKQQLPPGTPKPHDSLLQPGSLVFKKPETEVSNLNDYSQWWEWKAAANWRQPYGPGSSIKGKEDFPVVHIAYEDAKAYADWANRRLPTEAEWEYAARGGAKNAIFAWGDDEEKLTQQANTWTGKFPVENDSVDGFSRIAPVKSYPPNDYGLYEMAGNVWEYTQDWYNINYYYDAREEGTVINPRGAVQAFNPHNPQVQEKVIKGGSYLCHASYCASFRPSARMQNPIDSSHEHVGFRTVATPEMLK
ncbi:formylglycine-generating enzyme family protein [Salinimicrobium sp. GXAS 041]|uniref:formylglycine-generating enzyme family protein n=1 Tax=Salinimicrobium sp. GXAS 041 TaxID=3400806 RepID=UPI003C756256